MDGGFDVEKLFDSFEYAAKSYDHDADDDNVLDSWERHADAEALPSIDGKGTVSLLFDGTWHVCPGLSCPFAKESSEADHSVVCSLTSRTIGTPIESGHEASWTGRSCGSADPDMVSGQVSAARSWRFKKDAFAESANAHRLAATISTDEVIYQGDTTPKIQIKRGAPCVNEIDESAVRETKKKKAEKRATNLQELSTRERLREDAVNVLRKLFAHNTPSAIASRAKTKAAASGTSTATVSAADPRLSNFRFVFSVGLQKYAKSCAEARVPMNLSTIHDVAIAASKFVKQKKGAQDSQDRKQKEATINQNSNVLQLAGSMVVSLWSALCLSPYFLQQQTGDSFRPFVAGCAYGFKRGVEMRSGHVLPVIPELTNYLPTLRSTEVLPCARQLQASSHRGLCSVHRALSSIDAMESSDEKTQILEKLEITRRLSVDLQKLVQSLVF